MLQAKCILKFRDKNGKIIGYKLQDPTGYIKDVEPDQLKRAINTKKINITNLTLTSDYRLVDSGNIECKEKRSEYDKMEDTLAKARVLGRSIYEYSTKCNHTIYILEVSEKEYKVYIPNDVELVDNRFALLLNTACILSNVQVIGGSGLKVGAAMFFNCSFKTLDLTNLDTSNITDMSSMFENSSFENLVLTNFNTSKVTNMAYMFRKARVRSVVDIGSFDTSNVVTMLEMFESANIMTDFSVINTSNVSNMTAMFRGYKCRTLDLNHFNLEKCTSTVEMFAKATINDLIISNWRIQPNCFIFDMFFRFKGIAHVTDDRLKKSLHNSSYYKKY